MFFQKIGGFRRIIYEKRHFLLTGGGFVWYNIGMTEKAKPKEARNMRAAGVVCEFNPFHNGHAHLIQQMRAAVGDGGCVIALMSGRFVQRGSPAILDPYVRAEMALCGGADLVLELPFPWSAGSAEHFATAGMRVLDRLGVDTVAFGSESGDAPLLLRAAEALALPTFGVRYAALCREGRGTTIAYAEALREVAGFPAGFPASNDLLGIAYLRALHTIRTERGAAPNVLTVRREGAGYREDVFSDSAHPSATALRRLMEEAACDPVALEAILTGTMPDGALACLMDAVHREEAPLSERPMLSFFHAFYRLANAEQVASLAECGGGLAAHMQRCACEAATPEAFFDRLRTKQYTDARLRRAMLFGALEVTDHDLRAMPSHAILLAANARGCAYAKEWKKSNRDSADFAIVTKPADAPGGRQRELCERADCLYTLCFPHPCGAGELLRRTPHIE